MTVLFDTNILLDVLLDREYADEGQFLLDQARAGQLQGVVIPTVLTNTFYVGRRMVGAQKSRKFVASALSFLTVIPVSHQAVVDAATNFVDFEDGVISGAASEAGVAVICTRNVPDFTSGAVEALTPGRLIERMQF